MGNYQPLSQEEPPSFADWMIPLLDKIDNNDFDVIERWNVITVNNKHWIICNDNQLATPKYLIKYLFEYKKQKYALLNTECLLKLNKSNDEFLNDRFFILSTNPYV